VYSTKQWAAIQAAQAQQRAQAPTEPVPGVPADVWASMTPAEQAKLYADQANQRAIVAAQRESGRRISSTLWIILVLVPLAIFLVIMVLSTVH
jgi:hypothetical protein